MDNPDRREFIKQTSLGVAGAATASFANRVHGAVENSEIRVGLIGCGGRGPQAAEDFNAQPGVRVTHVCDVDKRRLASAADRLNIPDSRSVGDMRQIFDDPKVEAVYIATPDHWHAPAGILACDAGKHVYVEKSCSHNLREGRLFVEAARRNNRVVQHGTQVRSTQMHIEAIKLLHEGIIGDVLVCKAWNVQRRGSIGHQQPTTPPPELDYENWVGPAPMEDYQQNCVSGWHWRYNYGTGGIGNDGIHDIEYARWGLGVKTHPTTISAVGGKYFFDDDQQFPDTHQVSFEYPGVGTPGSPRLLIYEQRLWSTNLPSVYNCDSGVEYYGTEGRMFLSRRGKIQILGERNQRKDIDIETASQDTKAHVADFVNAIREDRRPNADIEIGHLTSSLCHLGNLSARLGRSIKFDPQAEQVVGDEGANQQLGREYRDHWATPI
jgi:predicted dehydrogenase